MVGRLWARPIGQVKMRAVANGVLAAILANSLYLLAVVLTTPSLPTRTAVVVAIGADWWVLLGLTLGVGVQAFLMTHASATCSLNRRREITGATGLASSFSSLVSMFSLVSVGCCGTWLYLISFLPGLLGTGFSTFLIGNSNVFIAAGFAAMAASILYTYLQMIRARKRNPAER